MKKKIGLFILIVSLCAEGLVYANDDLDFLLKQYKEASELSKKTRDESLGYLVVITREDLDRMQANSLVDVMKSIKMKNFLMSEFGIESLVSVGDFSHLASYVKLYINDQDVSSIDTNNPFTFLSNMPLDFIDHIEIYFMGSSIRLADEPSFFVMKIYTKLPERENATTLRGSVTSLKGYSLNYLDAREVNNDFSYLLFFSRSYNNRQNKELNNQKIKLDTMDNLLYLNLKYKKSRLEIFGVKRNKYNFLGFSTDKAPDSGKFKPEEVYFIFTQKFLKDDSLKFKIGFTFDDIKYMEENSPLQGGILLPDFNPSNPYVAINLDYNFKKVYSALTKVFETKKNSLFLIATYKGKFYDVKKGILKLVDNTTYDGKDELPLKYEHIYTFGLENQYNINNKNLLLTGIRYDMYIRSGGKRNFYPLTAKLGYIFVPSNKFTFKAFLGNIYVNPSLYQEMFAKYPLKQENYNTASFEVIYNKDKHRINILTGVAKARNKIIPDLNTGSLINMKKDYDAKLASIDYTYFINNSDKVMLNYFKLFDVDEKGSYPEGGYIKLFKTVKKLDIYSELVYRKKYHLKPFKKKIDSAYDLTLALTYNYNDSLQIGLKGVNLLGRGLKTPFFIPLTNQIKDFPVIDREYIFTVKYIF